MGATISIAGPTASGKSAVAMKIAEHLKGEIISVDSMQVYRGLDIGTAKPSAAEQAGIPHHRSIAQGWRKPMRGAVCREATAAERQIERPFFAAARTLLSGQAGGVGGIATGRCGRAGRHRSDAT